jgi:hypothetical protein
VQSKRSPLGIFPAQPNIFVMLQCLAIKVNAEALPFFTPPLHGRASDGILTACWGRIFSCFDKKSRFTGCPGVPPCFFVRGFFYKPLQAKQLRAALP